MAQKAGRQESLAKKGRMPMLGKVRSQFSKDSWLGRNWTTLVILAAIILVALFVRSYFGYGTSVGNGFLVAGGSDSYYHMRVIDHVQATGQHLVFDDLLNYPIGMRNARPPLYDWSVAVSGEMLHVLTGLSTSDATGFSLVFSTAIWGALTIIPVFLITRKAFGTNAGLIAGLLFALMPGHISRTILADADHDAMVLFFVVFAFYFLMLSLMAIKGSKWVSSWKERRSITSGMKGYIRQNPRSLIFAMMGGVAVAAVGMIWTGYTYILIIVLVYFLVQLIINRFRNTDSMGVMISVGTMLLTAFAVMAPLYWQMNYWAQWFDVPFYLFLGAMVIGGILVATRDYPWTIVVPSLILLVAVALVLIAVFMPTLFEAIISGQGYLVKSKLYSTIAEAQAPVFSDLVLSFGAITFWLGIAGVVYAATKIPKNPSPYLVFIVVWMGVSMYMAASAARFMFNASPAFAMAAGWIVALIVDMVHFEDLSRAFSGFWKSPLTTLRKGIKIKHIMVAFFLAFLIILPNTWGAVDAGMPSDVKKQYDKQVYLALPDFLHPPSYDVKNGSFWYFGAFPYSMPLPNEYWPRAWDWFSNKDTGQAVADRPAFLSWWDYGFEAIQQGDHPTVADNFQNGYQFAGSFLMAQNESDAVALLITRALEKPGALDDPQVISALQSYESQGLNVTRYKDIMANPANYVQTVKDHPEIYGPYDDQLSAANAKYAAARIELESIGLDNLTKLYKQIQDITGVDIGYFAVDSRLFPFTATSQNIFYAPAKLSDHRIDPYSNAPVDFYQIYAVDQYGVSHEIQNVTKDMTITDYQIVYKDMFYNSLLYKAFMGFGPSDIGATSQGIPGVSGSLANYNSMQGWNMSHFRMVYRTAYYNPYNATTGIQNHTDAWQAINYADGLVLRDKIANHTNNGTVDLSGSGLQSGVVFLQYYEGANVSGKVTSQDGSPYPNIWVTALDEFGIPHDTVQTDANGNYSLKAPFGKTDIVFSAGTLDKRTQIGTELKRQTLNISEAQANSNASFNVDASLQVVPIKGQVFWDANGNGVYQSSTDQPIPHVTVVVNSTSTSYSDQTVANGNGEFSLVGLPGMTAELYAMVDGHKAGATTINVPASGFLTKNIAINPGTVNGTLTFPSGAPAGGVSLNLNDQTSGNSTQATTDSNGNFQFEHVLPGDYTLNTTDPKLSVGDQAFNVSAGSKVQLSLSLFSAQQVSGTVTLNGQPQSNLTLSFLSSQREVSATTDAEGKYSLLMPSDNYTVYATTSQNGVDYVNMTALPNGEETITQDIVLAQGSVVSGTINGASGAVSSGAAIFSTESGAHVQAPANSKGQYRVVIPSGTYTVYAYGPGKAYWGSNAVNGNTTLDLNLVDSQSIYGQVWSDNNHNGVRDSGDGVSNAPLQYTNNATGKSVTLLADSNGQFNNSMPSGGTYTLKVDLPGYIPYETYFAPLDAAKQVYIQMVPANRTVSGTASFESTGQSGILVQFVANGNGAVSSNTTTDSSGNFAASLKPGKYSVVVDQNVTEGVDSSRYQNTSSLDVSVGANPSDLNLQLIKRVKVTGELSPDRGGSGSITFNGPDKTSVATTSSFETYLREGTYSVSAQVSNLSARYAYLGNQTVTEGGDPLNLTTEQALLLRGNLQYGTENITGAVPITFERDGGGSVSITSASSGSYQTYLPAGSYTALVNYHTKAKVDDHNRYVVYTANQAFDLSGSATIPINVSRSLDNVTLSGSVTGAASGVSWTFTAIDDTAINTTATSGAGSYSVDLAPGTYGVYAVDGSSNAFLGAVSVEANKDNSRDIPLVAGHVVSGTVSNSTSQIAADITFSDAASRTVSSGSDGSYSILLPPGSYQVTATGLGVERGVNVTFSTTQQVNVTDSDVTQDLQLARQEKGGVTLNWVEASPATVSGNATVTYNVTVTNTGNIPDTFTLSSDSNWNVTFSQKSMYMDWGTASAQTVQVTMQVPADAKVNHSPVKIKATGANTSASGSVNLDVNVTPYYSMNLTFDKGAAANATQYVYNVAVRNTGNADDTYAVDLTNLDQLQAAGWNASLKYSTTSNVTSLQVPVTAGQTNYVQVVMVKAIETPNTNATVDLEANSTNVANQTLQFSLELPDVAFGDNPVSATGPSVSMKAPSLSAGSIVLIALIVLVLALIVIMRVNLGVFGRRRKR